MMPLSVRIKLTGGLIRLFAFNSRLQADIPLKRSGKTRLISSEDPLFNNALTLKSHMVYRFCWSSVCFINLSLKVMIINPNHRTVSEK
ncbi:hypothetical protein Q5705_01505 [Kosakonia sp. H02]|nr:hypothetical protein Q5705_01505 [Kosakonia sp. H02]